MTGAFLRELRKKRGLEQQWVAARAGYAQPHYSKIEKKADISVEEYTRIMEAMDLAPGDYLRNSTEEIKPLMPLVEELKKFPVSTHERVKRVLQDLAAMLEEKLPVLALAANLEAAPLSLVQPDIYVDSKHGRPYISPSTNQGGEGTKGDAPGVAWARKPAVRAAHVERATVEGRAAEASRSAKKETKKR